jgi:hypothetical protein
LEKHGVFKHEAKMSADLFRDPNNYEPDRQWDGPDASQQNPRNIDHLP